MERNSACITTGTAMNGKWAYKTVVRYIAGHKADGTPVWLKDAVLAQATTTAKINRLATEEAEKQGLPLIAGVRHYSSRR